MNGAVRQRSLRTRTLDLVYVSLFAVMIAVCSWIAIPTAVPLTMQTFGVFCALGLLGGKRGTFAVLTYLLLGLVGVPVFVGFTSGFGILVGQTGGYLSGFLFMALTYWGVMKGLGNRKWGMALAMLLGLFVCYTFGTAWFMVLYAGSTGPIGVMTALGWCVFPFVIPDIAKMCLALVIVKKVGKYVKNTN